MTLILFLCTFLILIILLSKSPRRDYRWLKYAIGIILILGVILHWQVINMIPEYTEPKGTHDLNPFSIFVIALTSSAQMFLGSTRIFDNGFQDFLFTDEGAPFLAGLSFLYIASVFISLFAIFNFVFQRIFSKWKLRFSSAPNPNDEIHIFFGNTRYSRLLTKEIINSHLDKRIIVIEYPDKNDTDYDKSPMTGLHHLSALEEKVEKKISKDIPFSERCKEIFKNGSFFKKKSVLYLKARRRLSDVELSDKTIASILDIKGIDEVIFRRNSFLYFLSDNEQENIISVNNICLRINQILVGKEEDKKICHVFCHAKKEGYNISREDDYRNHFDIKFIDSSYLAIRQIIREDPESLPVHYVKIKKDDRAGEVVNDELETSPNYNLGYVTSDFNAAIFGFGELGHDAFDFLFEYGAFVGADYKRSKFHVFAYDKNKDNNLDLFKSVYPGLINDANKYIDIQEVDVLHNDAFWTDFKIKIKGLNYIFICTGADDVNLEILNSLDKCFDSALKGGEMRIMVKHSSGHKAIKPGFISHIKECVKFFGADNDIWKYQIISDELFVSDAKKYYTAYKKVSENLDQKTAEDEWNVRETAIYSPKTDSITRKKRIRQRSQDYAACLHMTTKEILIGDLFKDSFSQLALCIPPEYKNTQEYSCVYDEPHCNKSSGLQDISQQMLLNLAVGEHIRWVASHIVMGYRYGTQDNDEEKTHTCLVDYSEVPDRFEEDKKTIYHGKVRHYDWIVVKTTLEMLAQQNKGKE